MFEKRIQFQTLSTPEGGQLLPESVAWYSRRGNLGVAWAVAWRCLVLPGLGLGERRMHYSTISGVHLLDNFPLTFPRFEISAFSIDQRVDRMRWRMD